MPKYRANVKILLSHESRVVEAGVEFDTVFPKVKVKGELMDMKLGSNITLLHDPEAEAAKLAAAQQAEAEAEAARATAEAEAKAEAEAEAARAVSTDVPEAPTPPPAANPVAEQAAVEAPAPVRRARAS